MIATAPAWAEARHRIPVMQVHLPGRDHGAMDPAVARHMIRINGHLGATLLFGSRRWWRTMTSHTVLTGSA